MKAIVALILSALALGLIMAMDDASLPIKMNFEQLTDESKTEFVDLDITNPSQWTKVIETIDRLRHKLKGERSSLLTAQKNEHTELSHFEETKKRLCKAADEDNILLKKSTSERNVQVDRLTKIRRELMIAVTVKTKNRNYNEKIIRDFDSEEILLKQLLAIIEKMHSVSVDEKTKSAHAKEVRALLELLQTPSPEDRVKMSALDVGRVHEESLTLKIVLEKMLEDQHHQRELISKQEKHDESEVTRITKIVHETEVVERSKYKVVQEREKSYASSNKKCIESSGKYSEFSKVAVAHGKSTLKRIGVINHEISILNEMRAHINENMGSIQKYQVTKDKLELEHERLVRESKKFKASISAEDDKEARLLKKQVEEAQAELRKHKQEEAEYNKEALAAEHSAELAEQEAIKRQDRLEREAKVAKIAESKKKYEEKLARFKAAQDQADRKRKIVKCIEIAEKVTKKLLGVRYTPNFIVKQCSSMSGDDKALTAGVTRLVKGTAAFAKHRCTKLASSLFHKLLKRTPNVKEAKHFVKLCTDGATDKELSIRIMESREYIERVHTPHVAKKCLHTVRRLWNLIIKTKPSSTNVVFWSQKCIKGTTSAELSASFRELPEYRARIKKEKEQEEILRLRAESKRRKFAAAARRAAAKKAEIHQHQKVVKVRHSISKKQHVRDEKSSKVKAEIREKKVANKHWFAAWKNLPNCKRTYWWKRITINSKRICENKKNVCCTRKKSLQRYAQARTRLAVTIRRFNKAARSLRRGKANLSPAHRRKLRHTLKRNKSLARRWRKLVVRARRQRTVVVHECRKLTVQCRSAVFRYQSILRERVSWTKQKLAVWNKRASEAAKSLKKSHEPEDLKHFQLSLSHAKKVVCELKTQLHTIAEKREAWAASRRAHRAKSWRKTIDSWKKNAERKAQQTKLALHELRIFNKAAEEAKVAIQHKDYAGYRSALARAHESAKRRKHALRVAAASGHRAAYLLSRARESAVRRAKKDAAKRLILLKHARAEYEKALKSKNKKLLTRYHAALVRAHRLASRAHLDLKQAHVLSEKAKSEEKAIEAAKAHDIAKEAHDAKHALEVAKKDAWLAAHQRIKSRISRRKEDKIRSHDLFRAKHVHAKRHAAAVYRARHSLFRKRAEKSSSYAFASVTGDPHLKLFNGASLYLSGQGDYVFLKNSDFELQGRVRRVGKTNDASFVSAIAVRLQHDEVVEINDLGVLINGKIRKLAAGSTALVGGSILKGKDAKGIEYIKVSLKNGVFISVNYGIHSSGISALNVAVSTPSALLSTSIGLLNPAQSAETSDIEESNKATNNLFSTLSTEDTKESSETRLISVEALDSAEEICRSAFSKVSEIWHKCPRACIPTKVGSCEVDPTLLGNLDDAERRACQCVFDVAAAGSPWAQANAKAAVLEDENGFQQK